MIDFVIVAGRFSVIMDCPHRIQNRVSFIGLFSKRDEMMGLFCKRAL